MARSYLLARVAGSGRLWGMRFAGSKGVQDEKQV